jgi:hypothetical protein
VFVRFLQSPGVFRGVKKLTALENRDDNMMEDRENKPGIEEGVADIEGNGNAIESIKLYGNEELEGAVMASRVDDENEKVSYCTSA